MSRVIEIAAAGQSRPQNTFAVAQVFRGPSFAVLFTNKT
jgi:hypothetical protein